MRHARRTSIQVCVTRDLLVIPKKLDIEFIYVKFGVLYDYFCNKLGSRNLRILMYVRALIYPCIVFPYFFKFNIQGNVPGQGYR